MKTFLKRSLDRWGYRVTATVPPDVAKWERDIWNTVREITMTSIERVITSIRAAEFVARHKIPGAFVECGVWRGGSAKAMAMGAIHAGDKSRPLWLYDTFQPGTGWGFTSTTAGAVNRNLSGLGVPIRIVEGLVQQTIPEEMPDQIALLRLDTDFYESTKHELTHLYPRLVSGGICIIDDYGHHPEAKKAVDKYFEGQPVFLSRIDYTGRLIVKP